KWPRLYLTPATLTVLKKKFQTDKQWSESLLTNGKSYLARDSSESGAGGRANGNRGMGQVDTISLTLGLLFHLTGKHQYADKLYAALQSFGRLSTWSSPSFLARNPPWHSELGTARYN